MLSRLSRFVLPGVTLLALGAATAFALKPDAPQIAVTPRISTLRIDALGKGTVTLKDRWQFHTGDDPAWATPSLDDTQWEEITAEQPWGPQGHPDYTGFAWYRRHIVVSPGYGAPSDIALLIRHVDDAYELYWNGALIGGNGTLPPHPVWFNEPPTQTYGLGQARNGILAIRVWKAPLISYDTGELGGFVTAPVIGSPEAIAAQKAMIDYGWLRRRQFLFALDFLYGLVAALCSFAWLRDRRQWILFWMAGFALAPIAILFLDGLGLPWPFNISLGLQQPLYSLEDISLWFMLIWFLQLDGHRRLIRFTTIVACVNLGCTLLDGSLEMLGWTSRWSDSIQFWDAILTAILTVTEFMPLVLVTLAVVKRIRLDLIRWTVAITALLTVMMSVIQIAVSQGSRFTHWTLSEHFTAPLFILNGNPITPYLLFRTLLIFALIFAVLRYYAHTRLRRNALEQELQSVRELQKVLIPDTPPTVPGFTLTGAYRPAQEVGGDFFQVIPMEDNATLVILGDVSGKGLRAAMAVSLIVGVVHALAPLFPSPAELLEQLNHRLNGRMQGGFATCIAIVLHPDGNCVLASAGHPSPFLNGRELSLEGALPLGLIDNAVYEESPLRFGIGDQLALYTDGLLEARNPSGELFSFKRLESLFAAKATAEEATQAAVNFGQDDDITVLTLTRLRPDPFGMIVTSRNISETETIRLYPIPE
jgi:hypothetical protein